MRKHTDAEWVEAENKRLKRQIASALATLDFIEKTMCGDENKTTVSMLTRAAVSVVVESMRKALKGELDEKLGDQPEVSG